MSINLGELRAKITVATSEAEGDINKFQDKLNSTADVISDVGGRLLKAGTIGVGAIGALAMKGADWNAQVAGTDFLFQNLDKTVQSAINSNLKNAEAIGLTVQRYKDGATNISTYYKNMGMTSKEIANMSSKTMELVADLGAVVDLPFDEALARFKSGLMGNYEALDIFGISISASSLENSEFVKGLGKSWKQLSDNEKMLAVYNEIQRQGASATGLAKQEAGQFSMQMKLLKQELSETAGTIGETLLPILQPFLEKLREIVKGIREWVEEHPKLTGVILAVVGAISVLNLVTGALLLTIASCITTFLFWSTVLAPIGTFLRTNLIAGLISSTLQLGIFRMSMTGALTGLMTFIARIPLVGMATAGLSRGLAFLSTAFMGLSLRGVLGFVINAFRIFSLVMMLTGGDMDGLTGKILNFVKTGLQYLADNIPQWIEAGKQIITGLIKGIVENLPLIIEKAKEILVALYDGIVGSIDTILEVGGQIIDGIVQAIIIGFPLLIEYGQKLVEMLVYGLIYGIPLLLEATTTLIQNFTVWIENELPVIIEKGTDIIVKLIEGITLAIPLVVNVIIEIINAFVNAFALYFPLIMETGVTILLKIIEGIVSALPWIIEAGTNIITSLVNGIITLLPMIIETGLTLITTLINGIITALPMIISTGLTLVTTLIDGIIQVLPMIIDAGIQLLLSLIDGIVQMMPMLIDTGIKLILTIVDALVQNLPKIIDAGVKILEALINGIIKVLPQLVNAGLKLITTLVQALIQNLPQIISAGGKILKALIDGILQLLGALIECGAKLVVTLVRSLIQNAPKMLQAGKDLVRAVIDGLGSLAGSLMDAGRKVVTSILDGIKSAWGSVTSWVSSGLSKLNPFKGKMVVGVEGAFDDSGIAQINELARNGISAKPTHFGFAPRQGLFNLSVPKVDSPKATPKEVFNEAKEVVINTVVELEGYQIAKASARYMQEELSNINRKASRLGGVL